VAASTPINPETPVTPNRRARIKTTLEILGLILGPGIVLEQIGHLILPFTVPYIHGEWLPSVLFLSGSGLMALLLLIGKLRTLLPYAPWLLSLVLGGIFIFNRLNDKRPPIVKWSQDVVRQAKHCRGKDESECVFDLLSSYKEGEEKFSSDLTAGNILMSSPAVQAALKKRFGIDATFLGTGSSLPDFCGVDYSCAHIPEFLVPNRQDTDVQVWTWRFEGEISEQGRPLEEILKEPPDNWESREKTFDPAMTFGKQMTPLDVLQTRYKDHLLLNDRAPVVIRFGRFPAYQYHGYLGHPDRHWVFTSHLGELLANHFTLQAAASESGYELKPSKEKQTTFVWVFIPVKEDEVVRATWHSVFSLAAKENEITSSSE
jgi:hypothetical protein